jgi:hypothetical protein
MDLKSPKNNVTTVSFFFRALQLQVAVKSKEANSKIKVS